MHNREWCTTRVLNKKCRTNSRTGCSPVKSYAPYAAENPSQKPSAYNRRADKPYPFKSMRSYTKLPEMTPK